MATDRLHEIREALQSLKAELAARLIEADHRARTTRASRSTDCVPVDSTPKSTPVTPPAWATSPLKAYIPQRRLNR